ncbi:MAG: DUF2318 domain-containing protein [Thermodesulfobacteriota bacterium]|nr:DUF2318 domain-containing protein [Thermodesulfobacteriota bacterium]
MAKSSKQNKNTHTPDPVGDDRLKRKKEMITGKKKRPMAPYITGVAIVFLALAAGIFYWQTNGAAETAVSSSGVSTGNHTSGEVRYPLDMFRDGKARHFEFQADTHTIRYFILESADGVIRAAFDACDVCWPSGKGYYQEGDNMVCRNCGRQFASARINEVKGGCNPAPLKRSIRNENLIIRTGDILTGSKYFDFQDRG